MVVLEWLNIEVGHRIEEPSGNFTWERDLQWADGALLSLLRDENGRPYLFHWVDCDDQHNRWLATQSTDVMVLELLNGDRPLLDVLKAGSSWFFLVDVDREGVFARMFFLLGQMIPEDYLPEPEQYIDTELIPQHGAATKVLPVLLGATLSMEHHREIPKLFAETYGMLWAAGSAGRVHGPGPLRGGYSYVHFYKRLRASVKVHGGFSITKFQYSSPGVLHFSAQLDVSKMLVESLCALDTNRDEFQERTRIIERFIREKKLNDNPLRISYQEEKVLEKAAEKLLLLLPGPKFADLRTGGATIFQSTKLALGHIRRLRRLLSLQESGQIKLLRQW